MWVKLEMERSSLMGRVSEEGLVLWRRVRRRQRSEASCSRAHAGQASNVGGDPGRSVVVVVVVNVVSGAAGTGGAVAAAGAAAAWRPRDNASAAAAVLAGGSSSSRKRRS